MGRASAFLLWDRNKQSVSALSGQLELEASTLTQLLKRPETDGYLRRARNPGDERQVLIGLTDKGRELRSLAGGVSTNLAALSGMTAGQLQALNEAIRGLHDRLVSQASDETM
ncbi:MAG: MarR family transcriptional regulator [Hyphomonas sp.]|uniref:MarR family winged helix-turn-helix transcriptional regulator n=1 Tax=Hyphomonas sp. TaxID=87 RepID=UPI0034A05201